MKRNRLVIAGVGSIGMELLKKLPGDFDITCIDLDPESRERILEAGGSRTYLISGDATSRLVLEDAGLNDADLLLITTNIEKVNIEVARIAKEYFTIARVISVATTMNGTETLEELGVEAVNVYTSSAAGILGMIQQRSKTAHSIGLGKKEILEVEVHPNSRLANKPVGLLAPIRWRIGIIYRDENIIVPKKNTVLKPKDRVIILGDPPVLKTVSEILTFSFQRFPLEYGSTAVVYLGGSEDEAFYNEIEYIFSALPLKKCIFLHSEKADARTEILEEFLKKGVPEESEIKKTVLPPLSAIESVLTSNRNEYGLIMISRNAFASTFSHSIFDKRRKSFLNSLISGAACPVLITGSTSPYERVVIPTVEGVDIQRTFETAFELSALLNNSISALLVEPSEYISTEEEAGFFGDMKKSISDLGLTYKRSIDLSVLHGNPVKAVTEALSDSNLLIVDTGGWKKQRWFSSFLNPDVVWHIVKKSPISTLIIPPSEESL